MLWRGEGGEHQAFSATLPSPGGTCLFPHPSFSGWGLVPSVQPGLLQGGTCWREFTCRAGLHSGDQGSLGQQRAGAGLCLHMSLPPHSSPGPHPQALPPRCLPRAVFPGSREQRKFNYRYLFFQPSPQPVFGRLEQGNFGALPATLGNNTVFKLCLGL